MIPSTEGKEGGRYAQGGEGGQENEILSVVLLLPLRPRTCSGRLPQRSAPFSPLSPSVLEVERRRVRALRRARVLHVDLARRDVAHRVLDDADPHYRRRH